MILLNDIVSIKISDTYLVLYISLSLFYLSYKGLWAIFHLFEYYFTWLRLLHSRLLQKGIYHVLCVIHISLSLSLSLNRGVYPLWSGSYPPLSLIISFPLSVFLILPFTLSYTHCERAGECVPVRPVRVPPHTLSRTHPSVRRMESRVVCPRGLIRVPVSLFRDKAGVAGSYLKSWTTFLYLSRLLVLLSLSRLLVLLSLSHTE